MPSPQSRRQAAPQKQLLTKMTMSMSSLLLHRRTARRGRSHLQMRRARQSQHFFLQQLSSDPSSPYSNNLQTVQKKSLKHRGSQFSRNLLPSPSKRRPKEHAASSTGSASLRRPQPDHPYASTVPALAFLHQHPNTNIANSRRTFLPNWSTSSIYMQHFSRHCQYIAPIMERTPLQTSETFAPMWLELGGKDESFSRILEGHWES